MAAAAVKVTDRMVVQAKRIRHTAKGITLDDVAELRRMVCGDIQFVDSYWWKDVRKRAAGEPIAISEAREPIALSDENTEPQDPASVAAFNEALDEFLRGPNKRRLREIAIAARLLLVDVQDIAARQIDDLDSAIDALEDVAEPKVDAATVKREGANLRQPHKNNIEQTIPLKLVIEEIRPLIKRIREQSKRHEATVSFTELGSVAGDLEILLERWAIGDRENAR
jgi:hypothetical protein